MSDTKNKGTFSKHKAKAQLSFHTMMLPALIFAILFSIVPLFGLIMAFQKYFPGDGPGEGLFGSQFVDIYWFRQLFGDENFYAQALPNTLIIAVAKIIATTIFSIVLALLINEVQNQRLKKIIQVTIFLPYFLSWALIGTTFVEMFGSEGIVTTVLGAENLIVDEGAFRTILVVTDLWKNVGYQVVVFLAAITSINANLYEAADIDGAGHFQKCWHITIPGIKPMIVLMCILNIGNIMNAGFEQVLSMYNPLVYSTGDIIDTMAYREGLLQGVEGFSYGTAIGLFKSVISCVFFLIAYRIAFKVSDYKLF